jgi:hypothetical protein
MGNHRDHVHSQFFSATLKLLRSFTVHLRVFSSFEIRDSVLVSDVRSRSLIFEWSYNAPDSHDLPFASDTWDGVASCASLWGEGSSS